MRILITGAGGFIGTHLCNHLKSLHHITSIHSPTLSSPIPHAYSVDLRKRSDVENLVREISILNIDTIIHLASRTASPDNIDDLSLFNDNMKITGNLVFLVKGTYLP